MIVRDTAYVCEYVCTLAMLSICMLAIAHYITFIFPQRLDDTTPQVREAAFETIAILLKVVGDRPMNAYLDSIDKTKMAKASWVLWATQSEQQDKDGKGKLAPLAMQSEQPC